MDSKLDFNEKMLEWQMNHLASAILIDDYNPMVEIKEHFPANVNFNLKMPQGSLVSGSFIMNEIIKKNLGTQYEIKVDDIDLYFSSKEQAQEFMKINNEHNFKFENDMCAYGWISGNKVNLIYGVEFDSPGHLVSRFDIRACSVALDVNQNKIHYVMGAYGDIISKQIIFNPVPRGVSVRRLTKYINKGFKADKHQNLYFAQLIRSPLYDPQIELLTKQY